MEFKLILMIFFVGCSKIYVIADDINKLDCCLRYNLSCNSIEKWKYIYHNFNNEVVENVCIHDNYKVYEPPSKKLPANVGVNFFDKKVLHINERKNTITLLIGLWSFWEDPRINAKDLLLQKAIRLPSIRNDKRKIWIPFTFPEIDAAEENVPLYDPISAYVELVPGSSINRAISKEIFPPNATVIEAWTLHRVKIYCKFDFSKFPFDRQSCPMTMLVHDLNMTVHDDDYFGDEQSTFGGYELKQGVFLKKLMSDFYQIQQNQFGVYSNFSRQIQTYVYQCYIPCFASVLMSFSSFIIPVTAVPGRVAIIVTQFLTLTSFFIHQMNESPSESTLNWVGVYLLVSILLVFGTMVEFTIVVMAKQKLDWDSKTIDDNEKKSTLKPKKAFRDWKRHSSMKIDDIREGDDNANDGITEDSLAPIQILDYITPSKNMPPYRKTDIIAFFLFIGFYLLFNVIYFVVCVHY